MNLVLMPYVILSSFHLFDLDCENRPNIQLILTAANIHVYQYSLSHHHVWKTHVSLGESFCFQSSVLKELL